MPLDRVIATRVRESDAVTLEMAAEVAGLNLSEFVRSAALDEARRQLRAARRQDRREELRAEGG